MEMITILRELVHRRVAVGVAACLSLLAGALVAYHVSFLPPALKSREYRAGLASAPVLVDTPHSQVVAVNPKGADELSARASLIANIMATGPLKSSIAQRAGIKPSELAAVAPAAPGSGPAGSSAPATNPLAQQASAGTSHASHVLTIRTGVALPIILVEAQAPNAREAATLANAAVSGLSAYLNSLAASQRVPPRQRLSVTALGAAQSAEVTRGPKPILGLVAAVVLFVLACGALVAVPALVRQWRWAVAIEHELGAIHDQPARDPAPKRSPLRRANGRRAKAQEEPAQEEPARRAESARHSSGQEGGDDRRELIARARTETSY